MLQYYIYLILAVVCLALQFTMNKVFQNKNGSGIHTSLLYTTISGLITSVIFFAINGFKITVTPFSLACAFGIALLCLSYSLIGFKIFSLGNFTDFTMYLMLGGMMLPFLYGMFFLGEGSGISAVSMTCRIAGIILLTVSMVLPCLKQRGLNRNAGHKGLMIALCIVVFVLNGFTSIVSKLHQIETVRPTIDANSFVCLGNGANCLVSGIVLLLVCGKTRQKPRLAKEFSVSKLLLVTSAYAVFNGISYLMQLKAAASPLPASVQYPIVTGGSIVLTALSGLLFFKEKPGKWQLIGIVLSFASTFLFLF